MKEPTISSGPQIRIREPRQVKAGAILAMWAFGLILLVPVILAMLVVSVVKFGILTFLIPLVAIAIGAYLLPFGFGNSYITRLVASLKPGAGEHTGGLVVQLTLVPRLRTGLWALFDDADDFGWLTFTDSALLFQGDCVSLSVPFHHVRDVRLRCSGWRGLFLYGPASTFKVMGFPEVTSIKVAERFSLLLPASRRNARVLQEQLLKTQKLK